MGKLHIISMLICTAVFATLGGSLTTFLFSTPTAHAGVPGSEKVIEADTLEVGTLKIADKEGNVQVLISSKTKGMPYIKLFGPNGKCQVSLGIGNKKPYLIFYDEEGKSRFDTFLAEHSFATMRFFDYSGQCELALPRHFKELKRSLKRSD